MDIRKSDTREVSFRVLPDGRYELTLPGCFPVVCSEATFSANVTEALRSLCVRLTASLDLDHDEDDDPIPLHAAGLWKRQRGWVSLPLSEK